MLPQPDLDYLRENAKGHIIVPEAGMICILIPNLALPDGFVTDHADLLLRVSPGYPDVPPDMWWFDPPIERADHRRIPATDVLERHLNRTWQRWSRHLAPGVWRSGIDTLKSYVVIIRGQLNNAAKPPEGT